MRTIFIYSLSLIFLSSNLFSQSTPNDIANNFFTLYKSKNIDTALNYIFTTNKFAFEIQDAVEELKRSLKKTVNAGGNLLGYELLSKKNAGQNLTLLTFLVRYDKFPLTFRILFYKPTEKWQVQNFKFDNKIDDELEEAGKAYRLKENYED